MIKKFSTTKGFLITAIAIWSAYRIIFDFMNVKLLEFPILFGWIALFYLYMFYEEETKKKIMKGVFIAICSFAVLQVCEGPTNTHQYNATSNANYSASQPQTRDLEGAKAWLQQYLKEFPVGGGYRLEQILIQDNKVNVGFRVPDNIVDAINEQDNAQVRWNIITVACPSSTNDEIWNMVTPADVNMIILDKSGNFVNLADCSYNENLKKF